MKKKIKPRIFEIKERTYLYADLENTSEDSLKFSEKGAQRFIHGVRRKVPLPRIDQAEGYVLHLDPLCAVVAGEFEYVNQALCLPLAPGVTSVKGFETITFPETQLAELPLRNKDIEQDLSELLFGATRWANDNDQKLGSFWRLHNRFDGKGRLQRFAQVELVPAD